MSCEITLRPATRELCRRFYQGFENDPAAFPDQKWFKPYVYSEAAADQWFREYQAEDRMILLAMLDGRPIGEVTLRHIERERRECEFGIQMQNDSVKGLGYGTRTVRLALRYLFGELDLLAVNAGVLPKNTRSRHVLEKAGFRQVGEDRTFLHYRCERNVDLCRT